MFAKLHEECSKAALEKQGKPLGHRSRELKFVMCLADRRRGREEWAVKFNLQLKYSLHDSLESQAEFP